MFTYKLCYMHKISKEAHYNVRIQENFSNQLTLTRLNQLTPTKISQHQQSKYGVYVKYVLNVMWSCQNN